MYRVLFAEDELLVRLGLQNSIPWDKFDMELTAQADNGVLALELFKKERPDVVITDIRMDEMDGYELIQRIRELDRECAIIVISCLDDFETIRKMIPYQIIGYILKASMSMEEIFHVLEKARDSLKESGRVGIEDSKKQKFYSCQLSSYLLQTSDQPLGVDDMDFSSVNQMKEMLIFQLVQEDMEKINELAMKFVYELVERQIPGGMLLELGEKSFCLLIPEGKKLLSEENLEEAIGRIHHSVDTFLGVRFQTVRGERKEGEDLREWYGRILKKKEETPQGQQWDVIIRKAVNYMREHHSEFLGLAEISVILNISPSYFSHLFKKQTGKNYVEFLNEIRLEEVLRELRTSDEKIVVVAENHGFRNLEYFSRFFKKSMGISPAKWRQQNR